MTQERTLEAPPAAAFRAAMGCFPTGVALLTQGWGAVAEVMTVNCLTSVSLEPMLLLVGVRNGGRMCARLGTSASFAVNVLTAQQRDVAARFARPDRPAGHAAVRELQAVAGETGNVVLPSAVVSLECRLHARYPGGDHTLFLGEVVAINEPRATRASLVFHRSAYTATSNP
jgi:3-hydroxy-9,10-secoandrosta-1,3,5(10)-triene-9,17-dione monooxygenase reductase component